MDVSGQLDIPAALSVDKERKVHIGYQAGWAPGSIWAQRRREIKSAPPLTKIGPRSFTPQSNSQNIIRMIKQRRFNCAGHVARMEEVRNAYILIGKPERKT
jgi:hypothetical protein